jgi:hypothetical protein
LKRFARWRAYQEGVPVQVWALTFDDIHRG